ncbi:hypothetical protein TNCV_3801391 [Trichonephila clavipes]|nr:hypothetical protein TNCV_3801391 [Trichonephila clavipes]
MPVISLSFVHHEGDSTILLGSTPILRGVTKCIGQGPSNNLMRGLVTQRLFRVLPCREGIIHLQTPMPSPGFEPRPYGTTVHCTGWATF